MRRLSHSPALAVLALSSLVAVDVEADSLRCGRRLVGDGDSTHQVESTCGAPDEANRRREFRSYRRWVAGPCRGSDSGTRCGHFEETTIEVVIDEWTYDFGPRRFVQYLTFEQGRLVRVESGSYGNDDAS